MQIIVLGMHRSFTSVITRYINMMGAYCYGEGQSLGFAPDNPKGFWERRDVLRLNDALLAANGCSWQHLSALPTEGWAALAEEHRKEIKRIVLEMDAHRPWVMKDPRLCLTLPYWFDFLEVPVAVMVHRDPVEVAMSLHKRNAIPMSVGLALWEHYAVHALNASLRMARIFVKGAQVMDDPLYAVRRLYEDLVAQEVDGLRLPKPREIMAFQEERFYRARADKLEDAPKLTPYQQELAQMMEGKIPQEASLKVSDAAAMVVAEWK